MYSRTFTFRKEVRQRMLQMWGYNGELCMHELLRFISDSTAKELLTLVLNGKIITKASMPGYFMSHCTYKVR